MRPSLSKTQAKEAIDAFFQKAIWTTDELKKIKRLAMKYRLRLGVYRKCFCRKCLMPLRGRTRVTKIYKTIVCESCRCANRHRITLS